MLIPTTVLRTSGDMSDVYKGLSPGDKPPESPNAMDDEFDDSSFNTGLWTWQNQGGATVDESTFPGALKFTVPASASESARIIEQTITGTWTVSAKITGVLLTSAGICEFGLVAGNNGSGKLITWGVEYNSFGPFLAPRVERWNSATGGAAAEVARTLDVRIWYFRIVNDGSNLTFYASADGIGWTFIVTEALATHISSVDRIGIYGTASQNVAFDFTAHWFRKI